MGGAFGGLDGFQCTPTEHDFPSNIQQQHDFAVGFPDLSQAHQQPKHQKSADISDPQYMWYTACLKEETPEQKKRRKNREAAARLV